jgi:hypothetical protein
MGQDDYQPLLHKTSYLQADPSTRKRKAENKAIAKEQLAKKQAKLALAAQAASETKVDSVEEAGHQA